jgi:hypothetical protein
MLDVFLCGDTVETLWEFSGNIVENERATAFWEGRRPEGHFQNGLESIERDWAG